MLCLDTCAILDILRDPLRGDARAEDHAASLALLQNAETEGRLSVLTTDVVRSEFSDNVQVVQAEAEASLSRFLGQIAGMNRLAACTSRPGWLTLAIGKVTWVDADWWRTAGSRRARPWTARTRSIDAR